MQIGLVGLQYSGKTTLFHTLSGKEINQEQIGKTEAQIDVVKVPDIRLNNLTQIFNPKKEVFATIEVFDIPGLKMQDDGKVKITNEFLNNVKNNNALFYVIRQFKNDSVPHPMNTVDPLRDINFLETEFLFHDLEFLENRIAKLKKEIIKIKDDKLKRELAVIQKCYDHIEKEQPLRTLKLDNDELKYLSGFQLLTQKQIAIAVNFDEEAIGNFDAILDDLKQNIAGDTQIIPFFAEIEYELSLLDEGDRKSFMDDYGIKDSALNKILNTSYQILGLQSFFTVGEDECRAWTIKKNNTAQQAAGVIHTDFYNKFIRAEVVSYNDFMKFKSFPKCKEAGVWRLEGKEYIVADGDILNIRHS